jgi:hypothetical protein
MHVVTVVSEEIIAFIFRVSLISTLMMEAICSSETLAVTQKRTASEPRRPASTSSPPGEPQISE